MPIIITQGPNTKIPAFRGYHRNVDFDYFLHSIHLEKPLLPPEAEPSFPYVGARMLKTLSDLMILEENRFNNEEKSGEGREGRGN